MRQPIPDTGNIPLTITNITLLLIKKLFYTATKSPRNTEVQPQVLRNPTAAKSLVLGK